MGSSTSKRLWDMGMAGPGAAHPLDNVFKFICIITLQGAQGTPVPNRKEVP